MTLLISDAEKLITAQLADELAATANSEIYRLVAAGWNRENAVLFVHFSPSWPYADEKNCSPGILGEGLKP